MLGTGCSKRALPLLVIATLSLTACAHRLRALSLSYRIVDLWTPILGQCSMLIDNGPCRHGEPQWAGGECKFGPATGTSEREDNAHRDLVGLAGRVAHA